MLRKFLKSFGVTKGIKYSSNFYQDFFDNLGGMQFGNGVFNTIHLEDAGKWEEYLVDAFPRLEGKILPYAYTWEGTFFCVDVRDGKSIICDTGTSTCFALSVSMCDFLNDYVANKSADYLNAAEYGRWMAANGTVPYGFCAGWKIPLFLNGEESLDNRELSDLEVY